MSAPTEKCIRKIVREELVRTELRQHSADETIRDARATFHLLNSAFQLDDAGEKDPREQIRMFLPAFQVYAAAVTTDGFDAAHQLVDDGIAKRHCVGDSVE